MISLLELNGSSFEFNNVDLLVESDLKRGYKEDWWDSKYPPNGFELEPSPDILNYLMFNSIFYLIKNLFYNKKNN